MDNTSFLRELADNWMLVAMVSFYLTAIAWALSPWRRKSNAEAAGIPFRNDVPRAEASTNSTCAGSSKAAGQDPSTKESAQ